MTVVVYDCLKQKKIHKRKSTTLSTKSNSIMLSPLHSTDSSNSKQERLDNITSENF